MPRWEVPLGSKRAKILSVLAAGAGVLVLAVRSLFSLPTAQMDVPVTCDAGTPELPRDTPIKVLVWNVQFAAGREEFFYDGGEAVSVSEQRVEETLERIARVLEQADADIVLLQEVDRDSRRTHRIDQHARLLAATGYPCHVSTPYHKVRYVPHPKHEHMGRVNMHLSVYSKYRLGQATRWQLPLLDEPVHRRLFNLRRALLEIRMPIAGGGEFALFNTHLTAFSQGDGTLLKQVRMLGKRAFEAKEAGVPLVLAGDFNSLPPGFDKGRLRSQDQHWYPEDKPPVGLLFGRLQPAVTIEQYAGPDGVATHGTYGHFGDDQPDRVLDYVFHDGIEQVGFETRTQHLDISDHVPMVLTMRIP